jgi:hypothetical protein
MRWRRVALVAATATTIVTLTLVAGLVQMRSQVVGRAAARAPEYVDPATQARERAPMRIQFAYDTHLDRQWEVLWVQPASADAPPPPGLDRWTGPGEFAVSPGLADLIARTPALRARYRSYRILGDEGVTDRGELFAYARPRTGRTLPLGTPAFRRFGGGPVADGSGRNPTVVIVVGAVAVVVVPLVFLMGSALASATLALDRRAVLLHWIGVPRRHLRLISATEALIGCAPGAVIGVVVGRWAAGHLGEIPFTGIRPVPGDLVVPWWLALAIMVATLSVASVVAGVRGGRRLAGAGPRPMVFRRSRRLALVPFAAGAAALCWSTVPAGGSGAVPSSAATVLLMVGVPLALPTLAGRAGGWLAKGRSVAVLLAGRRIEADPTGAVRPLLGLAAVVFIILTGIGYVSATSSNDPPPRLDPKLDAATVLYWSPLRSDLVSLRRALPKDLVAAIDDADLTIDATCADLDRVLGSACDDAGNLRPEVRTRIGRTLGLPAGSDGQVHLGEVPERDGSARAVVVGLRSPTLSTRVEVAAGRLLIAPEVSTMANVRPRSSPIWGWIIAGMVAATSLLALAAVVAMVDGMIRSAQGHELLVRLGSSAGRVRRLELAQFGLLYAVTVGAALCFGLANAWVMIRTSPTEPIPVVAIAVVFACAAIGGVVGLTGVWVGCGGLADHRSDDVELVTGLGWGAS